MNSNKWRTRSQRIRTVSQIPVRIKIPLDQTIAVYQKLASKIQEMKALGMSYREIAVGLEIDKKTVGRELSFNRS